MPCISVIMAMTDEIAGFEQSLEKNGYVSQGKMEYRRDECSVHIVRCGVGARGLKKMNRKLELLQQSDTVFIAGIGGAVNGLYRIGDLVIPSRVCLLSTRESLSVSEPLPDILDTLPDNLSQRLKPCLQLATSQHLVDKKLKREIDFADVVDMETYHVAAWLAEHEVRTPLCVRMISDTRNQLLPAEQSIIAYMRDPRGYILKNIVRHPFECLRVLKLMLNSKKAVHILGECMVQLVEYMF